MKFRPLFVVLVMLSLFRAAYAAQSTITEAEGYSCMGDDKSRKQTEQAAMNDAKKNAAEYTSTYIKSETQVKNYALQQDLVTAYTNAEVVIIEELDKGWYKDPSAGDCYKTRIKAEVIPDQQAMERIAMASAGTGTPGDVNVPVAPPPVPDNGTFTPQGAPVPPDVVVVPSGGPTYVYMVPNTTGVYFYNGFWFRYYEGYWFRAPVYGRGWIMVSPVVVPRVVVNVPPEYPRYLPAAYRRINANDLNQRWQEWNRNHEWHQYDWYRNERKPEVWAERNALIQQEREEHRVRSRPISQTGNQYIWQQQTRPRMQVEYRRPVAGQQIQGDHRPVRQNVQKDKQRKDRAAKRKKQKKVDREKHEHR